MARPPRNPWPGKRPKALRFGRKARWRRWSTPRAYGVKPAKFRRPAKTWRQAWFETRPFIFLIALVTLGVIHQSAGFYEPPAFLQSEPTVVDGSFTRCGIGRGAFCVIDGDTFKLEDTKYRVTGIDTAEVHARCSAEAAQAEVSTAALQGWLGHGPFQITTRLDEPTDRYGRTLAIVKRVGANGREERLADWMIAQGGARGYDGGFRRGWC
jgi:endonuclease YncB( thermonuclease family)